MKRVESKISSVSGDFRQEEILADWREKLDEMRRGDALVSNGFTLVHFRAKVGTGTYIRTMAEKIGDIVELPALAFHIKRTKFFL